jgi:hypothetical protein
MLSLTLLEDHAFRACLAALGIQKEVGIVAAEVKRPAGITLHLVSSPSVMAIIPRLKSSFRLHRRPRVMYWPC